MYNKKIKLCKGTIKGYLYFYDPQHPLSSKAEIVYLHRHVASITRGSWLEKGEIVHHINRNKLDNSPENLLITTLSKHGKIHSVRSSVTHTCPLCKKKFYSRARRKYCSLKCAREGHRKVQRPTREQLKKDIQKLPWTTIGKKYGVSDKAIRKWARSYNLI